ncbi:MAG: hypothetical protein ACK4UJ_00020 [Leptonema sp. (in: bacteria)]
MSESKDNQDTHNEQDKPIIDVDIAEDKPNKDFIKVREVKDEKEKNEKE